MKQILEIIIGGDASRFGAAAQTAIAHLDRINRVGGRIATGALVAFGYFAKRLVDVASNIVDMSAQLSISASRLRAMETAGATLGVTLEDLGKAMREFQRSQAAAMRGPGLDRSAFEQLGISIAELKTLRPDEGVLRLSDALQKAGRNASTLDAALAILGGRTGLKLAGAMRSGWSDAVREIEKSGLIPTDKELAKVDDIGDRWVAVVKRIQNQIIRMAGPIEELMAHVAIGASKAVKDVGAGALLAVSVGGAPTASASALAQYMQTIRKTGAEADKWAADFIKRWTAENDKPSGAEGGGTAPDVPVTSDKPKRSTLPSADALARIGLFRGGGGDPAQRTRNQQLAELRRLNSQVAQLNSELTSED